MEDIQAVSAVVSEVVSAARPAAAFPVEEAGLAAAVQAENSKSSKMKIIRNIKSLIILAVALQRS